MKYFRQSHAIYHTEYHLVWIPRYRRKILTPSVATYLSKTLEGVRKWYPDVVYLERNIQPDHVHLLLSMPPRMSISELVRVLKLATSTALKKKFKFLHKVYPYKEGIWSAGYFVSTVGVNERVIRRYIRMQEREDGGQAQLAI